MVDKEYKFPKKTRFLVTGGAGFIGSNLVQKILDLGYEVVVLDNFSTGKKENIDEFMSNSKFKLIEGDIRNINDCKRACEGIDYVLHQAALCSVPRSINDPITTNEVNICGNLNILIAARDCKVKRVVYASSSSVYGDDLTLPKVENKLGTPLSPYAITKVTNELYAKNFYQLFGLPTIGLRYFNVFGKKQDPDSMYSAVIPIFVSKLLKNEPPIINGDGSNSRDFTYIDNVVQANLKACIAEKQAFGDAFNIGCGGTCTINDMYFRICKLLKISIKPIYGPERPGDVKHSNADISKAMKMLKYAPKYDFNKGLELCIDWYKNL